MASLAKHLINSSFLILIIITITLSSSMHTTHARDSQFFNKIANTNIVVPNPKEETPKKNNQQEQEPSFLPQNEESYGLYGHETGQLPPASTTTTTPLSSTDHHDQSKQPLSKYLPKNYNPVAYVTIPENTDEDSTNDEFKEETSFDTYPNTNTNVNGEETEEKFPTTTSNRNEEDDSNYKYYYNDQQVERGSEFVNNKNDFNYRLGSDFNSPRETTMMHGKNDVSFQPQGMSDTRFLENGKYHYDVNSGKFSSNHPYEKLKKASNDEYFGNYNRNYYGSNTMNNNENVFDGEKYNSVGGYESDQFQDVDNNMP